MRLNAYYYSFAPTGVEAVDRILSAIACAGKAYHNTSDWQEPLEPYADFLRGTTVVEWIQNAANDAAAALRAAPAASGERVVALETALRDAKSMGEKWRYRSVMCPSCRQAPHAVDCFIVALLDHIAAALTPPADLGPGQPA